VVVRPCRALAATGQLGAACPQDTTDTVSSSLHASQAANFQVTA
jgi:hypothetical protein